VRGCDFNYRERGERTHFVRKPKERNHRSGQLQCADMHTISAAVLISILVVSIQAGADDLQQTAEPKNLNRYQNLIDQIQREHGAYDQRLSEPLFALGLALKQVGDYDDAAEALERALHISRVNAGLYDAGQIPLVETLLTTNAARGDWESVNGNYYQLYWLQRRAYEASDPRRLDAVRRMRDWHLAAVDLDTGEGRGRHLIQAGELTLAVLEEIETQYGKHDPRYAQWLYQGALTQYYLAVAAQRGEEVGEHVLESLSPIKRRYGESQARDETIAKSYRRGRKLLNRLIALFTDAAQGDPRARALAPIYLADWQLLYDHRRSAMRKYHEVYAALLAAGVAHEEVVDYFSRPRILPVSNFTLSLTAGEGGTPNALGRHQALCGADDDRYAFVSWSRALPGLQHPSAEIWRMVASPPESYARVVFKIRDDGWPEGVDVLEHVPPKGSIKRRAQSAVWAIQFRPRLLDGEAVATKELTMCFVLAH